MTKIYRSAVVDAPVEQVWNVIRDFNDLPAWHPAITESEIEEGHPSDRVGCVRVFKALDGTIVREQLLSLSDGDHTFTYRILESPMPVRNYRAGVRLLPVTTTNSTFVEWWAECEVVEGSEQDLVDFIGDNVFVTGFEGVGKTVAA